MKPGRVGRAVILASCALLVAHAETLALNKTFVQKYMNKATIAVNLTVDIHLNAPHPISNDGKDGDIHIAGRADEVGLPLVAEIINAREESQALTLLQSAPPGSSVNVVGAWRVWFEHLGTAPEVQGNPVPVITTSNPYHLFEIHPVTVFGAANLLDSFKPIPQYTAYPAKISFPVYENVAASVQATRTAVMISSGEGKYNYTEFLVELAGLPQDVGDGYIVLGNVFDSSDPEQPFTAAPRRMIFIKGTDPADQLASLQTGSTLHVLGIPRVNLAEVFAISQSATTKAVNVKLPYEMIIVAILP